MHTRLIAILRSLGSAAPALIAATVVITGCSTAPADSTATATEASALEQFMSQNMAFGACEPELAGAQGAECARLEVPLDYGDPGGRTIELAVLRVPATGTDRIGSVVVNPGGPGGEALQYASSVVAEAWKDGPIRQRFDVVGLDPRGVGRSEPAIDCYSDEEREGHAVVSGIPAGGLNWSPDGAETVLNQCSSSVGGGDSLAHFSTRDAARDLDVLRSALGEDQLTFFGTSYGTRLGAVYAEAFPDNVRALVLDGAVDPTKNYAERTVQQFTGLQRSFEQLSAFCAQTDDCPLGNDPANATTVAQDLLQPLLGTPIRTVDGREVTFYTALEAVTLGLYDKAAWPTVIAGFTELQSGRADILLALRDLSNGRTAQGDYSNSSEATLAINCLDEQQLSASDTTAVIARVNEVAPFTDPGVVVRSEYGCAGWPDAAALDIPYGERAEGLSNALVIAVTGDGFTPYEGGTTLADRLDARLLTVVGEQHGTIATRNPCIDGIVADYIVNLKLPNHDVRCTI